jgi:hypothetical protein
MRFGYGQKSIPLRIQKVLPAKAEKPGLQAAQKDLRGEARKGIDPSTALRTGSRRTSAVR